MVNFVRFPALGNANEDGLLAVGGDLSMDTLVSAYAQGIFPWFNHDQPILWWAPDPRLIIYPGQVKISRSLAKRIKQERYTVSCNRMFDQVIQACALRGNPAPHAGRTDTWITKDMHDAYVQLHKSGYAHSIEVWEDAALVGGLYGVALGRVFFGESMFSKATDASKIALVALSQWLSTNNFLAIDCQVASDHLFSLGAQEIPRDEFLDMLNNIDINAPLLTFSQGFENLSLRNAIK